MLVLCLPSSQTYRNVKSFSPHSYAVVSASFPFFTKGTTVAIHTTAPGLERGAPYFSPAHKITRLLLTEHLNKLTPAQLRPQEHQPRHVPPPAGWLAVPHESKQS